LIEILTTVVIASLVGSLHCIGMCGPFVAFYSGGESERSKLGAHVFYNLGRLSTYLLLGIFAGSLGAAVNVAGSVSGIREAAAIVAGSLIVVWGAALLLQASGVEWVRLPAPAWLNRALAAVLPRLLEKPPLIRGLVLGMSSTLLPCGWLYGFAVTAAGTGSAALGASVMGAFWIGTVPAMFGAGMGLQSLARVLGPRLGMIMPALLVVMGLFTIANRGFVGGVELGSHPQSLLERAHDGP